MYYILTQLAQTISASDAGITVIAGDVVVHNILNITYSLAGIIAIIMIIIGGFTYTTSAGNPASVTKAKNTILYSVIGLVVVIAAFAITNFVLGWF